jgi:Zn-dependent M28 family amino/carboxypeptidase
MLLKKLAPFLFVSMAAVAAGSLATRGDAPAVAARQLLKDVEILASPEMQGRRTGTEGSAKARSYIVKRFEQIELKPFWSSFETKFTFGRGESEIEGVNLIGHVKGVKHPDRYIVVSAHYDHLGERNGQIWHGADDNASGVGGLLALAHWFVQNPPENSIIFLACDAEEMGLRGSRAFVSSPPVPVKSIALNVNLDMIGRNDQNELFAAGTRHYPSLKPLVEAAATRSKIKLRMGHDGGEWRGRDDWTFSSDHGAFHSAGIPFIYFGVEDHEDYHQPSDTFDRIQPKFIEGAVLTILDFLREADRSLDQIIPR